MVAKPGRPPSPLSSCPHPRSIVHLCLRKADQKLVILKQIPVEQMSKDERLAAQNECQVLKLLSHPNVIEYYENFLEDKALMIAMEYAPGGPGAPPTPAAGCLADPGDGKPSALLGSSCHGPTLCSLERSCALDPQRVQTPFSWTDVLVEKDLEVLADTKLPMSQVAEYWPRLPRVVME